MTLRWLEFKVTRDDYVDEVVGLWKTDFRAEKTNDTRLCAQVLEYVGRDGVYYIREIGYGYSINDTIAGPFDDLNKAKAAAEMLYFMSSNQ